MRVVAVEYLNTLPLIYGIRRAASKELYDGLQLVPPAQCAELAKAGQCDIALVPVAALSEIPNAKIITSFCLSTAGAVNTVALLSNTQLEQIHTIYRDSHSRTSVKLCEILCDELWNISAEFKEGIPLECELASGEAIVAIGDKVFDIQDRFKYKLDLGEEWYRLTALPFVFAVWVALTPRGLSVEDELDSALEYGVKHIEEALDSHTAADDPLRPRNLHYLNSSMEYDLSDEKLRAMELFQNKIK